VGGPRVTSLERAVTQAVEDACGTEIRALKPGNVHVYADGHGMTVEDFLVSARVAAEALGRPGRTVGERILSAVEGTWEAVGRNTNLGIVLLCAPLAHAALAPGAGGDLRERLARVLEELTVEDAELAYRAIRRAAPAGLGRCERHDVHDPPTVTLAEAMAAAAGRDRVAHQYATRYEDVFALGVPRIRDMRKRLSGESEGVEEWAATSAYLGFLAHIRDTHVARKYRPAKAESVRRRAAAIEEAFHRCGHPIEMRQRLLDLDAALKAERINPGTSADLTVASLLAVRLADILPPDTVRRRGSWAK
jgi:triphosphoribosyl-dephospho-CoA synthase